MNMYASVHVSLLLLFLAMGATATCDITAFNDSVQLIVDCGGNEVNITVHVSTVPPLSSGNNSLCFNQNGSIVTGSALLGDLAFSRDAENECTITECSQVLQPHSHFVFVNSSCFQDIDECSVSDSCNATTEDCSNTIGGFNCSCKTGFSPNNNSICEDRDECVDGSNNCSGDNVVCRNTLGSYDCVCVDGYEWADNRSYCEDIDECSTNICTGIKNSQCNNTLGGYTCCSENQALWTFEFITFCANFVTNYTFIPYCTLPQPTYVLHEVEPYTAYGYRIYQIGYECHSSSGNQVVTYTHREAFIAYQSGNPILFDITGVNQFGNGTQCTFFGFVFSPDFFVGVAITNSTCYLDRDECVDGGNDCSGENVVCRNTLGSYNCDCVDGYEWADNRNYCEDINECTSGTSGCSQNCTNTPGLYQCSCRSGYQLATDKRSCSDINECIAGTRGCSHSCINLPGSFQCSCRIGYQLASDGRGCDDINECTTGKSRCSQICINSPGSFQCSCRSGFLLSTDRLTCNDIDECQNATLVLECVENSTCIDTPGSFECTCGINFEGDGKIKCRRSAHKDHTVLLVSSILPSVVLILIVLILMTICIITIHQQHFKKRRTYFYPKSPSVLTDIDDTVKGQALSIASNDYVCVTLTTRTPPGGMCNQGSASTTSADPCNVPLGPTTNECCNGYDN